MTMLGHALDDLSAYGVRRLFGTVAFGIALDHKPLGGLAHLDSTSISLLATPRSNDPT